MVITSQRPLLEKEQKRLITLVNFQRSSALKSGQFSMPSNTHPQPEVEDSETGSRQGALKKLEPCAVKVARTVLRGGGGGNAASLPNHYKPNASGKRNRTQKRSPHPWG